MYVYIYTPHIYIHTQIYMHTYTCTTHHINTYAFTDAHIHILTLKYTTHIHPFGEEEKGLAFVSKAA